MANGNGWTKNLDPRIVAWIVAGVLYLIVEAVKLSNSGTHEVVRALESINAAQERIAEQQAAAMAEQLDLLRTAETERRSVVSTVDGVVVPQLESIHKDIEAHRRAAERSNGVDR